MPNLNKPLTLYLSQFIIVVITGLYLLVFGQWHIETNMLSLLPKRHAQAEFETVESMLFNAQKNQFLIAVSGDKSIEAYHVLHEKMAVVAGVEKVEESIPTPQQISKFYAPFRHNLLSEEYKLVLLEPSQLTPYIYSQLTQLSNPFVGVSLAYSPRLNLAQFLQSQLSVFAQFESVNNIAFVQFDKKRHYIARFQLASDGLTIKNSQKVAVQITRLIRQIEQTYAVDIFYSGIMFHTAQSSLQAESEITTFGLLSVLAIILLIVVVFRSLWPLHLALMVITLACFYGFTALVFFFDELHILTLVFAITLIGIVIDYCFHSFVHLSQRPQHCSPLNIKEGSQAQVQLSYVPPIKHRSISDIKKPLFLGFITTALGYIALMLSPLTLLTQVAVFMVFGLLGALLCVVYLLPRLKLSNTFKLSPIAQFTSNCLHKWIKPLLAHKVYIYLFLMLAIALSVLYKPVNFNDDIRLLNSSPSWLLKNEQYMAKIMGYADTQKLIVKAKTEQDLLKSLNEIHDYFSVYQPNINVKSISGLLPSVAVQQKNYSLIQQSDQKGHFVESFALTGLTDPIPEFTPLTLATFEKGPLSALSNVYVQYNKSISLYGSWVELSNERLSGQSIEWVDQQENIRIYNVANDISVALEHYRTQIMFLLFAAFAIVCMLLTGKYGVFKGVEGGLVILISALGSLLLSQLYLGQLNIFNLLAEVLILALAIDYVIFYQEQGVQKRTLLAILLSALSSIFVFGMLVFSVTPAVKSFGMTVMFGILFILILAPLTSRSSIEDK